MVLFNANSCFNRFHSSITIATILVTSYDHELLSVAWRFCLVIVLIVMWQE